MWDRALRIVCRVARVICNELLEFVRPLRFSNVVDYDPKMPKIERHVIDATTREDHWFLIGLGQAEFVKYVCVFVREFGQQHLLGEELKPRVAPAHPSSVCNNGKKTQSPAICPRRAMGNGYPSGAGPFADAGRY